MQWLKSYFLRISIHRQIQVGIFSVSIFVCLLVLNLVLINCFILISASYYDVIDIFEKTESQQLEAVSINIGFQQYFISEISFLGIQWIRNFLDNLSSREEFTINIDKSLLRKYSPEGYKDCDFDISKKNCIIYKTFSEKNIDNINRIVAMTYPFLYKSLDYKVFQLDSTSNVYNRVSIFSKNLQSVFTFPNTEISTNFNKSSFDKYIDSIVNKTHEFINEYQQYNFTDDYNFLQLTESYKSLIKSPVIRSFIKKEYDPFLFSDNSYVSTFSPKYNLSNVNNYSFLSQNDMIDTVFGYWDSNIIDELAFSSVNSFRGIKMIFTSFMEKDLNIISTSTCTYYLYLYKLYNPISNFNNKSHYNNITDCLGSPLSKQLIKSYIFDDKNFNDYIIRRKLHLPVLNEFDRSDYIYFSVYKYLTPDYFIQSILNSDFFTINKIHLYLLKSMKYINQDKSAIFYKFTALLASIMMTNLLLWILIILVIFINTYMIIDRITKPIGHLIHYMTSMSKGNTENVNELIIYDHELNIDNDISELFKICKQLIKGGYFYKNCQSNRSFNEEQKKTYNQIATIKSNNLIIDEKELEKSLKQSSYIIYNYRRNTNFLDYRLDTKERDSFDQISEKSPLIESRKAFKDYRRINKKGEQYFIKYNSINEDENKMIKIIEYFVITNPITKNNFLFNQFKDKEEEIKIFDLKYDSNS